jgi:hypothetical protein
MNCRSDLGDAPVSRDTLAHRQYFNCGGYSNIANPPYGVKD